MAKLILLCVWQMKNGLPLNMILSISKFNFRFKFKIVQKRKLDYVLFYNAETINQFNDFTFFIIKH